jgi:hypothetical protein
VLVLTLLVRDEEDILEANLEFHLNSGVDLVIATDHRSVDDTSAILERYRRAGVAVVFREEDESYQQARWVTHMARFAFGLGADWVINSDADEFWWPVGGDLRSALSSIDPRFDVVQARRADFPPVPGASEPFWVRQTYRDRESRNLLGQPLPPKVAHRARHDIEVAQGNHAVHAPALGPTLDDGRIEILHFPLRTYAQFERKIVNGGSAYEAPGSPPVVGQTWRVAYHLWRAGRLPELYDARVLGPERLAEQLESGALTRDTRLRDSIRTLHLGGPD